MSGKDSEEDPVSTSPSSRRPDAYDDFAQGSGQRQECEAGENTATGESSVAVKHEYNDAMGEEDDERRDSASDTKRFKADHENDEAAMGGGGGGGGGRGPPEEYWGRENMREEQHPGVNTNGEGGEDISQSGDRSKDPSNPAWPPYAATGGNMMEENPYYLHQHHAHPAMAGYGSAGSMGPPPHHPHLQHINPSFPMEYFGESPYTNSRHLGGPSPYYNNIGPPKNDGSDTMQPPTSPGGRPSDIGQNASGYAATGGGHSPSSHSSSSHRPPPPPHHSAPPHTTHFPPGNISSSMWNHLQLPGKPANHHTHYNNPNNSNYYDSIYSMADLNNVPMDARSGGGGRIYDDGYGYEGHNALAAAAAASHLHRNRNTNSSHFCPPPSNIPNQGMNGVSPSQHDEDPNNQHHYSSTKSTASSNSNNRRPALSKVYVSPSPSDQDTDGISPSSTLSSNSYATLSYPHQQNGGRKSKASRGSSSNNMDTTDSNTNNEGKSSPSPTNKRGSSMAMTDRKHMQSKAWYDRFRELQDYKKEYGNCMVPQKYEKNPSLGIWVNKQRMEYKLLQDNEKSSMTPERLASLQSIGFIWAKRKGQATWDAKFKQLKEYKEKNGDCLIPTKYAKDPALGRWVSTQREQYRLWRAGDSRSKMTEEKVRLLEESGFVWRLQF